MVLTASQLRLMWEEAAWASRHYALKRFSRKTAQLAPDGQCSRGERAAPTRPSGAHEEANPGGNSDWFESGQPAGRVNTSILARRTPAAYIQKGHSSLKECIMQKSMASIAILALGAMLAVGPASAATGMPGPQIYTPPKMLPTPQYYTTPGLQAYYGTRYRSYDPSTNTIRGRNGIRRTPFR
jgi:hypothetical protein